MLAEAWKKDCRRAGASSLCSRRSKAVSRSSAYPPSKNPEITPASRARATNPDPTMATTRRDDAAATAMATCRTIIGSGIESERVIPPPDWASVFVLAHAVTEAIGHTAFVTAPHAEQPDGWTIGWGDPGKAADVRPVRAAADHPITREAVAAYLAKYATKSTEATGHLSARITPATIDAYADDTHTGRLIDAAWTLGLDAEHRGLRRWAHTLGYGGHFFTKSRRYTGTFTAERHGASPGAAPAPPPPGSSEPAPSTWSTSTTSETTDVLTELTYVGIGWHTTADAVLANTAAAMAREKRQAARDVARTA